MIQLVTRQFPRLVERGFVQTSPPTPEYNCIAFTLGDLSRWWWPPVYGETLDSFWPAGAPAQETLEAFLAMYQLFGFELCHSAEIEPEYIKIALFAEATESLPAHAALQLPSGRWASKMWSEEDLMHDLDSLEGPPNHFRRAALVRCSRQSIPQALSDLLGRFG